MNSATNFQKQRARVIEGRKGTNGNRDLWIRVPPRRGPAFNLAREEARYSWATRFARSRADKRHYLITVSNYRLLHVAACPAATLRH